MRMFLSIFEVTFKITHVQKTDDVKFYILGPQTATVLSNI